MSPALAGRFLTTKVPQNNFIYLFIFGCAGSLLLQGLFCSFVQRGYYVVAVCGLLILVHRL